MHYDDQQCMMDSYIDERFTPIFNTLESQARRGRTALRDSTVFKGKHVQKRLP